MLKKILPNDLYDLLKTKVNFNCINEIRMRVNKPVVLAIGGQHIFLGENGVTANVKDAIRVSKIAIEDIIFRASECSIYSVNDQIRKGFIVTDSGVRIGLGGDLIEEKGTIKTMTNFTSLNIRIPHQVKNCSLPAFDYLITNEKIHNTLIISPPGAGKTTFLRDFIWQLSERNFAYNILVLDERGELDMGSQDVLGNFADKIAFASKKVGFENGIRSLSPNLIVTDELGTREDVDAVQSAINSGVSILASVHSDSIESFCQKENFDTLLKQRVFQRFVLLSMRNGPGTIEGIYNENFSRLRL
ncbi:MAG: hypothetical protein E7379_01845 [Clostridiales bacterium]|nr:hypothetical protein [Clostridiales bacterium]